MPLSVTCQCGAKLEIDEKFLGKEIPCPDCQRPLPTKAAAVPPPLELPNHKKTSGLALLSLTLALVFMCIPIGALAAIVTGIFAIKQILKYPSKLEGINYARAGIALGGFALLASMAAMISPYVLGVDQLLREFAFSSRISYSTDADDRFRSLEVADAVSIKRPAESGPRWAKWTAPINNTPVGEPDSLLLINTHDDAYIACFKAPDVNVDDIEGKQKKVIERFFKSELLAVLAKVHGKAAGLEGAAIDGKTEAGVREVTFEMRVGRITQRFLILFRENEKHDIRVVVGAARRNYFDRLQKEFREAFKSVN